MLDVISETMTSVVLTQGVDDRKDRQLMLDKISFMSGVGEHENVVKFVASCNDVDEGVQITAVINAKVKVKVKVNGAMLLVERS